MTLTEKILLQCRAEKNKKIHNVFFFCVENEDKGKQNAETCESLLQLSFRDALSACRLQAPFQGKLFITGYTSTEARTTVAM